MFQNDPIRLPPFHFYADPDPDRAFHFDADPYPASQSDADPRGSGSATLPFFRGVGVNVGSDQD